MDAPFQNLKPILTSESTCFYGGQVKIGLCEKIHQMKVEYYRVRWDHHRKVVECVPTNLYPVK